MLRDDDLCCALFFLMQRASSNSVRVMASPKNNKFLELTWPFKRKGVSFENQTSFKNSSFLRKPLAHGYPLIHIGLSQLLLDLNTQGINFEILNQNAPNKRYRDSMFLTSPSQISGRTLADWLRSFINILECSDCYWWPRGWETRFSMIFTSTISFKVRDQLENLTPVWKFGEIELPSVSYLNNLERLNFAIYLHAKIFSSIIQGMSLRY